MMYLGPLGHLFFCQSSQGAGENWDNDLCRPFGGERIDSFNAVMPWLDVKMLISIPARSVQQGRFSKVTGKEHHVYLPTT